MCVTTFFILLSAYAQQPLSKHMHVTGISALLSDSNVKRMHKVQYQRFGAVNSRFYIENAMAHLIVSASHLKVMPSTETI